MRCRRIRAEVLPDLIRRTVNRLRWRTRLVTVGHGVIDAIHVLIAKAHVSRRNWRPRKLFDGETSNRTWIAFGGGGRGSSTHILRDPESNTVSREANAGGICALISAASVPRTFEEFL